MNDLINYNSPSSIKTFLESRSLNFQKKFGQNFLINQDARKLLLDALMIKEGDTVWEIGAGLGAMTAGLLKRGAFVSAFEIDRGYCEALREFFGGNKNFCLVEGDVLKTSHNEIVRTKIPSCNFFLLGNLPYNIAASVIAGFIENKIFFKRIVITVQKEVAARMQAKPKEKDYSSLSVLCATAYNVRRLSVFKGEYFYPIPNVDSAGVCFELKENFNQDEYPKMFYPLVRSSFASRRKTIKNNLIMFLKNKNQIVNSSGAEDICFKALEESGIAPNERAENLSLDDFKRLALSIESIFALK
ncbi:ribosomal RNA small subunit methyltransferase A [Spirochaetia bacterium]|nr:ribosomal RNA small subunit methyltransferase A [Spirochaetia bacterium]